jgi:hypothetical protein
MSIPPKMSYGLNAVFINISMTFFTQPEENPKIHIETQKIPNRQSNPECKELGYQLGGITILDLKTYYRTTVTRAA